MKRLGYQVEITDPTAIVDFDITKYQDEFAYQPFLLKDKNKKKDSKKDNEGSWKPKEYCSSKGNMYGGGVGTAGSGNGECTDYREKGHSYGLSI